MSNDPSRGQQNRNLQPTASGSLQAPPQYSNPPGVIQQQTYTNPYQTSYAPNPSFGYPPQARMQHPAQIQQPLGLQQQQAISPTTSRKRRASEIDDVSMAGGSGMSGYAVPQQGLMSGQVGSSSTGFGLGGPQLGMSIDTGQGVPSAETVSPTIAKKGRTNTPWTPGEEQRLKIMRDAGNSWSEIAKTFPARTEGSVKKHWYKDMHYADFGENEGSFSTALLTAIKEYEASKWKVIGQKVGKPAKACEQYAKEHFGDKT